MRREGRRGQATRRKGRRRTHNEHLRAVHPPAGRDVAADRRAAAGRPARLSAAAGLGAAPGRLSRPSWSPPLLPGRQRRDHGLGGHHAARAPVRPDAVAVADDLGLELRQLADHAAVRPRPQHRRGRAGRAGRHQRRRRTCCRRTLPAPPTYSKSNPADTPILTLARQLRHPAARRRSTTYADSILAQKISQVAGRRAGHHQRRAEAGGARAGRSARRSRARGSAWRTCARPWSPPTSTSPRATSTARARTTPSPPTISSCKARQLPAARARLQQRRADPPAGRGRRHRRRGERRSWPAGPRRTARHHPQRAAPARAPTSSRSPIA